NVCHRTDIVHERYYVDGTAPDTYLGISWGDHPWIPGNPGADVRVAIYNSSTHGAGDYFDGGQSNNWDEFQSVLNSDPEGRFTVSVITELSYSTLAHYDVLVLPDNGVPNEWLDDVDDWFTADKRIVAGDSSICFVSYAGYLWSGSAGSNGKYTYWDYNSDHNDSRIALDHPITSGYSVGQIISSVSGDAQMYIDMLPGDAQVLTTSNNNSTNAYVVYRDVPGKGSIVVLGVHDTLYPDGYDLVRDACASGIGEWYGPEDDKPHIICINDDVHFEAWHWGDEPCIYPYNHTDRTYYRWEWWNPDTEQYEWYPTAETPGAINGSTILVSSHADQIQYNGNSCFWHYQTPPEDGYIYWMPYTGDFYFTEGCNHTLYYFSKDDLCNTEAPNVWHVGVDDMKPETNITFYGNPDHYFQASENLYYMQNDTQICLEAHDMPENENCQTGIWHINYTVWRWVGTTYDIKISTDAILSWAPVYHPDTNSYIAEYQGVIDSDNSGDITTGDYLDIQWTIARLDGWYLVKDITKVGTKYLLNIQDATSNDTGNWEVVQPWTTVYNDNVCLNMSWFEECGKYEIHYYAVDYNKWIEDMHVPDIMVDCTPPHSTKTFGQPVLQTEIEGGETVHIVNATTPICFSAVDPRLWDSGVRDIQYRFETPWETEWTTFENVSEGKKYCFTLEEHFGKDFLDAWIAEHGLSPDPAGFGSDTPFILLHRAIDNVSHEEPYLPTKQKIYYNPWLNETPPTIAKGYEQPNIHSQLIPDLHYIRSDTNIWLHGIDDQGGLVEMQVVIIPSEGADPYPDEEGWWTAWNGTSTGEANITFTIDDYESEMGSLEEGTMYYLFFRAIDHFGLKSDEGKQRFFLDETPPTTDIEELGNYTYGDDIVINVTAVDNLDEVNVSSVTLYYRYRFNETAAWGEWTAYGDTNEEPYTLHFDAPEGPGHYEFYATATDGLGNEADEPVGNVAQASTYVEPVAADFNGDGQVNILDMAIIGQHWGETGEDLLWDLNGDGTIGLGDLILLAQQWTG
ncbi:MAG: dockerin type I domain-containing protein, partial [Thermoplasmatota archaeon]